MSGTLFDVIVFDFDGTLVQSADVKRQAFFDIFPPYYGPAVVAVLEKDPDGSRYRVIPEMIAEARQRGLPPPLCKTAALVEAYGERAAAGVAAAPEMPGAGEVLRRLSGVLALYVVSATPDEILKDMLVRRAWLDYLEGAFGYPNDKSKTVATLLIRHGIEPSRLLVVGDGKSDRIAAARNNCPFHLISSTRSLSALRGLEMGQRV